MLTAISHWLGEVGAEHLIEGDLGTRLRSARCVPGVAKGDMKEAARFAKWLPSSPVVPIALLTLAHEHDEALASVAKARQSRTLTAREEEWFGPVLEPFNERMPGGDEREEETDHAKPEN